MKNTFIGTPMERREDLRLLRGRGEYVDDVAMPGLLYAVVLRSSVAHGRLISIDAAAALKRPGVHAVITAADMPGSPPIVPMRLQPLPEFKPFEQPVIAHEKVRYVGEPVAVVLADSVAIGEDALDFIEVKIDELPPVADWTVAQQNKSILFEKPGTNRSLVFESRKGDADAAFAKAPYVRRERLRTGRHYGLTMEPRGVMATWDEGKGKLTVYGAAKVPFFNRRILSAQIGLPVEQIEMIENDVGGGYGARGEFYPEDFLIPFAARHVRRPVKWIEDRRENLMAMNHAREEEAILEVACERDGTLIAIRGEVHTDMGAYMRTNGAVGARNVSQFMAGPYRVPHVKIDSSLWMTNKTPVGTYRGPGRFEANFFLERMIDLIAADLGVDRIEFRRKNLITAKEQPYPVATVQPTNAVDEYDSGDYPAALERTLKEFDWPRVSKLQGKLIDGKYHGAGIVCFIEGGAAGPKESARLEVNDDGTISVYMGTSSVGQGVETVFAQIAADALELPIERIRHVYHGSTAYVSDGYGAYHSRSTVMGGSAVLDATSNFMTALREAAGKKLGCAPGDVKLDIDKVTAGAKSILLKEFAGLTAEGAFLNKKHTYSYGAHAAHITVDPRIGRIEIIDYVVVQDVGRAVNPLTLRGQVIGSLVQGLGGAVLEDLKYDENGQFLTGSLADYLLPTATDFPNLRCFVTDDYPSPINPLGAKGAGEGGIIAAGGCMANAVANALQSFGAQPRQLPLSPGYIWELVQSGERKAAE
ncbi:MAG: xanthine dehydrogenase family protein molybdopterin-binding subunit [Xanthobacteraceae bacterium]|nr:xanthine dehydrogenase family protein molybdopterin-binding subunit [Xanthobacteraceae bacterium]